MPAIVCSAQKKSFSNDGVNVAPVSIAAAMRAKMGQAQRFQREKRMIAPDDAAWIAGHCTTLPTQQFQAPVFKFAREKFAVVTHGVAPTKKPDAH
jgi:hypothetical protein